MILKEVLDYGKIILKEHNIEDSDIILKMLIEYVFGIEKQKIIIYLENEIDDYKVQEFKKYIEKLKSGIPIQYITNKQEFMKLEFYVDENVLIPQPDTEILVEEIIEQYKNEKCKILDLCTGSGAIGISLAKYLPNSQVFVSDISEKAIQIAKLNSEKNGVHNKIIFFESDMFKNIDEKNFDIIVSNPPYIETDIIGTLDMQVKNEPHIALDGGKDGLKFYRIIAKEAIKFLKPEGKIFLEIGYNQKLSVEKILNQENYKNIYLKKDLGNNDRAIIATVRG